MRFSRFIKTFNIPAFPGSTLIFSTKKTSLALMPNDDFNRLKAGENIPAYQDDLLKLGMMVSDRQQEMDEVSRFYDQINHYDSDLTASVILGMRCNFNCRYCFQGKLKGNHEMSDRTADQLIEFLKENYTENKNRIHLDFYGGEPLLYIDRIKYLAKALKNFVEEKGGVFDFKVVTNGSLLTPDVVNELKEYGLVYAKVTIDGLPMNHNYYRPFRNGRPTFDKIVENIEEVSELVDLGLGGNFTVQNYEQFPLLLDKLKCNGIGPEKLRQVSFNMVVKTKDKYASPKYQGGCSSVDEPWFAEAAIYIREEVLKRGYFVPKLRPDVCAIGVSDHICINHDGSLYKCLPLVGREQFVIGDIWSGSLDFKESHHVDNWLKEEKCKTCDYLPLCFGGCRYMQYQKTGSMAGVDCQKEYFDKTIETMIVQDLQYRDENGNVNQPKS